jgi:hypothetical protein
VVVIGGRCPNATSYILNKFKPELWKIEAKMKLLATLALGLAVFQSSLAELVEKRNGIDSCSHAIAAHPTGGKDCSDYLHSTKTITVTANTM